MQTWRHPQYYAGFSPVGDYLILAQHRESGTIDRSNWTIACEILSAQPWDEAKLDGRPAAYHWRASHPCVGWIEYLCVRQDAPPEIIEKARDIGKKLRDYPILNEDHHSELEWNEVCDYWAGMSVRSRLDAIQYSDSGDSIFAARHDYLPPDDSGRLLEFLRR